MEDDLDVPIALRRASRGTLSGSASTGATTTATTATPRKPKTKKRVRFSENEASSTGLTPFLSRSILRSPKRRRHSTPARTRNHNDGDGDEDELAGHDGSNEVRFLSLRQVLDDRTKRRIKRNGLSEEMNNINDEKRSRGQAHKEELQRLRHELAEKDDEIERLRETTRMGDTNRILELQQQVDELRSELELNGNRSGAEDQTQAYDWTLAAKDPFSDSYVDDEGFGDTTMGELVCSTPSRARASFPTPPCTSPPPMPDTPCSLRRHKSPTPPSHAGVQANIPDPEKEALEAELGSLRFELTKLTQALEDHDALKARMRDRIATVHTSDSEKTPDIETHLEGVLQTLSDRTAALLDLNSSISSLGFPGNDASEIIASLVGAFRSARLELEYLTPGEITLPLSSHGAEVLNLVLSRLRDLARKVREDDESIDEYHALELSLRQQLNSRVDVTDDLNNQIKAHASQLREKDERILELEVGVDRLKGAVEDYRRDIVELEGLVQCMETEGDESVAKLQTEVEAGRLQSSTKDDTINELESRLAGVLSQTAGLRIQLADVQAKQFVEITTLNKSHGRSLALRDARVLDLRREIDGVNEELRKAHDTICQLRVENGALKYNVDSEKSKVKAVIDSMKAELERVLKMSGGILATPNKGESSQPQPRSSSRLENAPDNMPRSGSYLSGDLTRTGKGKGCRYDSGLGFLDEEVDMIEI